MKMKYFQVFILIFLFLSNLFGEGNWKRISPNPLFTFPYSASVADGYAFFLCRNHYLTIIKNGGRTLQAFKFSSSNETGTLRFQQISFADSLTGILYYPGDGVLRTTDGGQTWQEIFPPEKYFYVCHLRPSGRGWLLGNNEAYRTEDAGVTWTPITDSTLFQYGEFSRLFSLDDNNLWLATSATSTEPGAILHSTDGGTTWEVLNTGLPSDSLHQLVFNDIKIRPSGLGFVIGELQYNLRHTSLILRTTDFGASWSVDSSQSSIFQHILTPSDSIWILYREGFIDGGAQLISRDKGITWSLDILSHYGTLKAPVYIPDTQTIILFNIYRYYRSKDFGQNYTPITYERDLYISYFAIDSNAPADSQLIIAGNYFSPYFLISPDGGLSWRRDSLLSSIYNISFTDVSIASGTIYAIWDEFVIIKSTDGGHTWNSAYIPGGYWLKKIKALDSEQVIVSGHNQLGYGLFFSSNGGARWNFTPLDSRFSLNSIEPINNHTWYAAGNHPFETLLIGGIYQIWDRGYFWRLVSVEFENGIIHFQMVSPTTGFASNQYSFYKTSDGWKTWEITFTGDDSLPLSGFCFQDSLHGIIQKGNDFYLTADGGITWEHWDSQFPSSSQVKKIAYTKRGDIILITNSYDLFMYTEDNHTPEIPSVPRKDAQARGYQLYPNQPNPFNALTKIRYKIHDDALVDVSIYNLLGQKVSTLVHEWQSAGEHEISFDARNLSSGIYLYILRVNDFQQVRKMILLK